MCHHQNKKSKRNKFMQPFHNFILRVRLKLARCMRATVLKCACALCLFYETYKNILCLGVSGCLFVKRLNRLSPKFRIPRVYLFFDSYCTKRICSQIETRSALKAYYISIFIFTSKSLLRLESTGYLDCTQCKCIVFNW